MMVKPNPKKDKIKGGLFLRGQAKLVLQLYMTYSLLITLMDSFPRLPYVFSS